MQQRRADYSRQTKETDIKVKLDLDGESKVQVQTGLGWADHMLHLLGFWAGFDMEVQAQGDLEVDGHHTLEDAGLCLGEALHRAIGDKAGLTRVGWAKMPMDEALSEAIVDISGRPYLVYQDQILPQLIFGQEKDLWREFFKSFAFRAGLNLHIIFHYGQNGHHLLESAFKACGLALAQALQRQQGGMRSSKGSLD
ncbi:MAG: imidazoleglycerol-phosphate dehydratase HisB [Desulfohalobiaceae bacterium]